MYDSRCPGSSANVAGRSEPVRVALEKQLKKKAIDIRIADLEKVTELRLPQFTRKQKPSGTMTLPV